MWCDEVCGKKGGRRSKGDTCWWNLNMTDIKEDKNKVMCRNNTENKNTN